MNFLGPLLTVISNLFCAVIDSSKVKNIVTGATAF